MLQWDEDKIGTLNSLGLLGRLRAGIQVERRTDLQKHEVEQGDEVMPLLDLPGLTYVRGHAGKQERMRRCLEGWKFGLGVDEVESTNKHDTDDTAPVNVVQRANTSEGVCPNHQVCQPRLPQSHM